MKLVRLEAHNRTTMGTAKGRRLRSKGRIPAVLYGRKQDVVHLDIDSAEIKKQLKEAMTDRRVAWDIDRILAEIKGGVLLIKKINAVKASIVVNRVKNLPVTVHWKQNAITRMDVE